MRVLLDRRVELLMLNVNKVPADPLLVLGEIDSGPHAQFVFVVSAELHLVRRTMRIEGKQFLPVVFLSVNERDKQLPGLRTEHVLEDSFLHIGFEMMVVTGGVLTVLQQARIASAR